MVDSDDDVGGGREFEEGEKVEARYRGGKKFYKGKITQKRSNGTYDILYTDDNETEKGVSADLIKAGGGGNSARRNNKVIHMTVPYIVPAFNALNFQVIPFFHAMVHPFFLFSCLSVSKNL